MDNAAPTGEPVFDWDAVAGLIVLRAPKRAEPEPMIVVVTPEAEPEAPPPAAQAARWVRPDERLVVLRAPYADRFRVDLFKADAPALNNPEGAWRSVVFDVSLQYDSAVSEPDPEVDAEAPRTRLTLFEPAAIEAFEAREEDPESGDEDASDEAVLGAKITELPAPPAGARADVYLETFEKNRPQSAPPFAASAVMRKDERQGPTVRAWPPERREALVWFGWAEESLKGAQRVSTPGFEVSRFPCAQIDLTALGPEGAQAAASEFVFFHAPLEEGGYRYESHTAQRGEVVQEGGKILLRHVWFSAQHRDVIGFASSALSAELEGPLAEASAPVDPRRGVAMLYLGETAPLLDLGAGRESGRRLPCSNAARVVFEAIAQDAAQHAFAPSGAEAPGIAVAWAYEAAGRAGRKIDFTGARLAAPSSVVAQLATLLSQKNAAVAAAIDPNGAAGLSFERFKQQAEVVSIAIGDPRLARRLASARRVEAEQADMRKGALARVLSRIFGASVAHWAAKSSLEQQAALWEITSRGADLTALRASTLAFSRADLEALSSDVGGGVEISAQLSDGLQAKGENSAFETALRRRAASVAEDLGLPGAALAQAPEDLPQARALGEALRAARAAAQEDWTKLRALFAAGHLPAPDFTDAWDDAGPEGRKEGDADIRLHAMRRQELADRLWAAAQQWGVSRAAFEAVRTRFSMAAGAKLFEAGTGARSELNGVYRALGTALGLAPEVSTRDVVIEELLILSGRFSASSPPPSWRTDRARNGQERRAAEIAEKCREAAENIAQARLKADANSFSGKFVLAVLDEAARHAEALLALRGWIAARRVWGSICARAKAQAQSDLGSRRLPLLLSEPPERWAEVERALARSVSRRQFTPVTPELATSVEQEEPSTRVEAKVEDVFDEGMSVALDAADLAETHTEPTPAEPAPVDVDALREEGENEPAPETRRFHGMKDAMRAVVGGINSNHVERTAPRPRAWETSRASADAERREVRQTAHNLDAALDAVSETRAQTPRESKPAGRRAPKATG